MQVTTHMRATRRPQVQRTCLVSKGCKFFQSTPHDRAFAKLEIVQ
jgi:hypothetical protein